MPEFVEIIIIQAYRHNLQPQIEIILLFSLKGDTTNAFFQRTQPAIGRMIALGKDHQAPFLPEHIPYLIHYPIISLQTLVPVADAIYGQELQKSQYAGNQGMLKDI